MTEKEEQISSALIIAGQMLALEKAWASGAKAKDELVNLAKTLDIEVLEEFLHNPTLTPDFIYTQECKRMIKLAQYLRIMEHGG
jgi:hypothetical protein